MTAQHDPTCTACEHDCPHRRTAPAPLGAPWCDICDDHADAVDAGYYVPTPTEVADVERIALAWLDGSDYVTTWTLDDVTYYPDGVAELTAQDNGHPSNVLRMRIEGGAVIDAG